MIRSRQPARQAEGPRPAKRGSPASLRWAAALPGAIAMVAGEVGVVAARLPAGRVVVRRFYAPIAGPFATLRLEAQAWRAWAALRETSPNWRLGSTSAALIVWCWLPAVATSAAGWAWASSTAHSVQVDAELPAAASLLAAVVGRLALRLAPWAWQALRVRIGAASARQALHAAEHTFADPAGLTCGATILALATILAAALEAGVLATTLDGADHAIWLTGPAALGCVLVAVRRGLRPPPWLHRLMAWARPTPTAAAMAVAVAAAEALDCSAPSAPSPRPENLLG